MAGAWAVSGVDLHLDLAGTRVRAGLEAALRDAVRTGRLRPGTRLPPSRTLAVDLGVARNTVADAYGQLVAEGWLTARPGAGTWVAERPAPAPAPPSNRAGREAGRVRYDLRPGVPDLSGFPRTAWLAAARRALHTAPYDSLGYDDGRGRPELRRALAEYLARARGVVVSPDRVVVCAGFTECLALVCQVLRARGATTLATEAYGVARHVHIATTAGLRVRTVPVDDSGASVGEVGDADAVLLTPAHQFPLGMSLGPARRRQVVEWAAKTSGLVIEDDYDGEFRYDRQAVGAMQALAPEAVVYAGSASKSLAPGLRLGWLVPPVHLLDDIVAAKHAACRLSSSLDQLTLARFIDSGDYDRHVRRSRFAYRRRRDRLVEALGRKAPQVRVSGIAAGLHALVELPVGQSEDQVVRLAAQRGLSVDGLGSYNTSKQPGSPALVVGYATPPEHAFTTTLARLCAVLADLPTADQMV
ncbi:MAG TPA: PLP-dependent aminotransferase family protein [Mycobacteriales bacterium]